MFTHLHAHSHYSFLSGSIPAEDLPVFAKRRGMTAIALTDTNNVTGVMPFYKSAKNNQIKPIIGVELKTRTERAVLLARNFCGYSEICKTLTDILRELPQIKPKLSVEELIEDGRGLPNASIPATNRNSRNTEFEGKLRFDSRLRFDGKLLYEERLTQNSRKPKTLAPFLEGLSDNVFILSSTPSVIEPLAASKRHQMFIEIINAERELWPKLRMLYTRHKLGVVATNNVFFSHPDDFMLHRLLRAIETNTTIGTIPRSQHADPSQYFTSELGTREFLRDIDERAFRTVQEIADACNIEFDIGYSKFATFRCGESPIDKLIGLARARFNDKGFQHGQRSAEYENRFQYEIRTIGELGVASYFLAVWDMIEYAHSKGFPHMGRGSGANSFIAFLMGISNVDPVKYNLQFERFLNPDRNMPPDFDIDFSWKDRYTVIEYMMNKYGRENSAMLCSIQTFRDRGAIREAGKALGYTESEMTSMRAKLAINRYSDVETVKGDIGTLKKTEKQDVQQWLSLVERLQQVPRHLAMHSGGMVLLDQPVTTYCATQLALHDFPITQQDMHSADDWKMIKLDVLATRGIGTYWDTMRVVEERYGKRPPIEDYYIAFNDEKTKSIIREGGTKGCFYIESPAMISLLRKLRTDTFENLTAASSVIRPGVAQSGMMDEFIKRHHDPDRRIHLHPKIGELMSETYGIMVYQEDVLTIVHELAGVSRGKADLLRRAMSGKERSKSKMEKLKADFIHGCCTSKHEVSISPEMAAEIWRQIASFSGYSFCKAHSASYAVLSFQEAWLKAYYPTEFLCSVLNNYGGFYGHQEYIDEAKRLGIRVLLPDVNKSQVEHHVEEDGVIRLGFAGLKKISELSIQNLLTSRVDGGMFSSIEDFAQRSGVGLEDGKALISLGACDTFGLARPEAIIRFSLLQRAKGNQKHRTRAIEFPAEKFSYDLSHLSSYDRGYIFANERQYLGYSVTDYPNYFLQCYSQNSIRSFELNKYLGKKVEVVGHVAASKYARTKRGDSMCMINVADEYGMIDAVIWPELFKKHHLALSIAEAVRITGKVVESFGVPSVVCDTVEKLDYAMMEAES